jgi:tetratricopeptide (TPR) repeat protein
MLTVGGQHRRSSEGKATLSKDGVSLSFLAYEFVKLCGGREQVRNLTTADVCFNFIIPWTKDHKTSYLEIVRERDPHRIRSAHYLISHCWKSPFLDLLDALRNYFDGKDLDDIIIWLDIISFNQHLDHSLTAEWLNNIFRPAVYEIGHTVLVLSTWKDPAPLHRSWCLLETFYSAETKGKFGIAFTEEMRNSFVQQLRTNEHLDFFALFCSFLTIEDADASNNDDKDMILSVARTVVGTTIFNATVFHQLLDWLLKTVEHLLEDDSNDHEVINLKVLMAEIYSYQGHFELAENIYKNCLDKLKRFSSTSAVTSPASTASNAISPLKSPSFDLQAIRLTHRLASIYHKLGKYQEADIFYRDCLNRRRRYLSGQDDIETILLVNQIALLAIEEDDLDEAEILYKQSIELCQKILGKEHLQTFNTMNHLANLYMERQNYEDSEPLLEESYQIQQNVYGQSHPKTLETMKNLGINYIGREKYYDGEHLLIDCFHLEKDNEQKSKGLPRRKSYETKLQEGKDSGKEGKDNFESKEERKQIVNGTNDDKTKPGMNYVNVLDILSHLGDLFAREKRTFEAISIYQDYLDYYKTYQAFKSSSSFSISVGEDEEIQHHNDLKYISIIQRLCKLYLQSSNTFYDLGERLLMEAYSLQKQLNHENDVTFLTTLNLLCDFLEKEEKWNEMSIYFKEYLTKIKRVYGVNSEELISPLQHLIQVNHSLHKYDEEVNLLLELLEKQRKILAKSAISPRDQELYEENTLELLNTLKMIASAYYQLKKYDLSENYYKECFQIQLKLFGENHLETMDTLYQLALLTLLQGKYFEGEILVKKCYEKSKKIYGEEHSMTRKVKDTISKMHEMKDLEDKRNVKCIIS